MKPTWKQHIVIILAILVAACSPASQSVEPSRTPIATAARPATWTPTPVSESTPLAVTPIPTRTLTPPVTAAPMKVVVAENNAFSIQVPSNWTITQSTRRVEGRNTYEAKYFAAVGPGDPPQPGVIIFYEWPSSIAVTNDNIWESAYALTALVIKSCATQLGKEKLPIDFGGEQSYGVEYVDACGAAGLVTGAVHRDVNYGALFEAPAPYYNDWFPTLRDILLSLTFGR